MGMSDTFSVIVATKNRPADLGRLFDTLRQQTSMPDELIIVDQSEDAKTSELVACFTQKYSSGLKLKVVYVHRLDCVGAGPARNIGIECASGMVLVFLDDDVLLDATFIEELKNALRARPDLGGVSGVVKNYQRPPFSKRVLLRVFWIGPFHDERQPIYWKAARLKGEKLIPATRFGSGLMGVRRSALGNLRFDPYYDGPGEDVEITWRIGRKAPLVIAPRAQLIHAHSPSGRVRAHWLFPEARSAAYLYEKLWFGKLWYRACFGWLKFGLILTAFAASLRNGSLEPWRAYRSGLTLGRSQGSKKSP